MIRTLFFIAVAVSFACAELDIEASRITGNVQIKTEEGRKWETLEKGTAINDNDIIQTSYKSNCEIRLGKSNILFMGSNSRILMSKVENGDNTVSVSVTLFAGSVYSKINNEVNYTIYTSTSLCKVENAMFNCTVDEVTGITGYHVFKGAATVSNISVQGEQPLKSGETSTIAPNTPPSSPRKISAKQMSVLTRFYGADFINQEIEATGLEVVSSGGGSAPAETAPVQSAEGRSAQAGGSGSPGAKGKGDLKGLHLFDNADAMRRLSEYDQEHYWMYGNPAPADLLKEYRFRAALLFSQHSFGGTGYPDIFLRPGIYYKNVSAVLNLAMVADSSGALVLTSAGPREILDKIHSIDANYQGHLLHIGEVGPLTFGRGLLVRDYTNRAFSDNVRNTGLRARYQGYLDGVDFFTSGLSDFRLVGLQYASEDTMGSYSAGLVRDNGEKAGANNGDLNFRGSSGDAPPALPADSLGKATSLTALEVSYSRNLFYVSPVKIEFYLSMAGFIMDDKMNLKGFGITIPGVNLIWGKQGGLIEMFLNRNRFTRGLFGPFYEDNLYLYRRDTIGAVESGRSLASMLPTDNTSIGFRLGYRVNPLKKLAFSVEGEGVVVHFGRDTSDTNTQTRDKTTRIRGRENGSLDIRLLIGDRLIGRVNRLEAYYSIRQVGFFDDGSYSLFRPNPFTTAGVKADLFVLNNLEGFAAWEFYYYDRNGDGKATLNEKVSGFSVGLAMGF